MSSNNPFGPKGSRAAPPTSRQTSPDDAIVRGTGLRPLENEQIVHSLKRGEFESNLQGEGLGLFLTDRRLILHGTHRIFLVIPSGRKVRAAYLEDVDTAGVQTKRLSQWLLAVGLFLLLVGFAGMIAGGQDDGSLSRSDGVTVLVVGAIATLLWILIKRDQVVFSVAGSDHFEFDTFKGSSGTDRAAEFLNAFYRLRPELKVRR